MTERVVASLACLGEVGFCGLGELHRKFVFTNFQESVAELVDRVVADWDRTMAAGVDGLYPKALGGLFANLNVLHDDFAVAVGASPTALVQGEGSGDKVGFILCEPVGAVEG